MESLADKVVQKIRDSLDCEIVTLPEDSGERPLLQLRIRIGEVTLQALAPEAWQLDLERFRNEELPQLTKSLFNVFLDCHQIMLDPRWISSFLAHDDKHALTPEEYKTALDKLWSQLLPRYTLRIDGSQLAVEALFRQLHNVENTLRCYRNTIQVLGNVIDDMRKDKDVLNQDALPMDQAREQNKKLSEENVRLRQENHEMSRQIERLKVANLMHTNVKPLPSITVEDVYKLTNELRKAQDKHLDQLILPQSIYQGTFTPGSVISKDEPKK